MNRTISDKESGDPYFPSSAAAAKFKRSRDETDATLKCQIDANEGEERRKVLGLQSRGAAG
jgi:hypothetical protein